MTIKGAVAAFVVVGVCLFSGGQAQAGGSKKAVDAKALAERVVADAAGIKEGDIVFISGNDLDLVEELGLAVQRHGGLTLETYGRPMRARRYYDEVPAKYDAMQGDLWNKLVELPTVVITVGGMQEPQIWKTAPSDRIAAVNASYLRGNERLTKRNVRQVLLGNGLFPTAATAKALGVTQAELEAIFRASVATDPAKLAAAGDAIRARVAKGKELHVTAPNGTDVKMSVTGRPVLVSDGVISGDEAKKGGASAMVFLPAGEAYVAALPGTAEGKVVWDKITWRDGFIEGLTVTVAGGKVTSMTAKPSAAYDQFKAYYDKSPACRDVFGAVDFGLNPDVKAKSGKPLLSWLPQGMVAVLFGGNTWAGGTNECSFDGGGFLPGATVSIDGSPLVEKGVFTAQK